MEFIPYLLAVIIILLLVSYLELRKIRKNGEEGNDELTKVKYRIGNTNEQIDNLSDNTCRGLDALKREKENNILN